MGRPGILLIDNNTDSLRKLFNYLMFKGFRVTLVDRAESALKFLQNNPVSLIISQGTLLDADITQLEEKLMAMEYSGKLLLVSNDPLLLEAIKELRFHYRYHIEDPDDFENNEMLINILLSGGNREYLLQNSYIQIDETIQLMIPSLSEFIDMTIQLLIHKIENLGEADGYIHGIRMALTEALANAIEHGNRYDFRKKVKITSHMNDRMIEIKVEDEGPGFDWRQQEQDLTKLNEKFSTRGRGMVIIRQYMDEVQFEGRGNIIRMRKYFKKPHDKKNIKLTVASRWSPERHKNNLFEHSDN